MIKVVLNDQKPSKTVIDTQVAELKHDILNPTSSLLVVFHDQHSSTICILLTGTTTNDETAIIKISKPGRCDWLTFTTVEANCFCFDCEVVLEEFCKFIPPINENEFLEEHELLNIAHRYMVYHPLLYSQYIHFQYCIFKNMIANYVVLSI